MERRGLVLLLLTLVWLPAASTETVTVYGDDNYAPVIAQTAPGPSGILINILNLVSQKTGDTYVVELAPWNRSLSLAAEARGGLIGTSWNAERAKQFDFSVPLYSDDIQLVMLKGKEFPFRTLDDLKGRLIGGITGASYGAEVDAAIASGLFLLDRDHAQAGRLLKLLAKRIDGAFIGNGTAGFEATLQQDPELLANRGKLVVATTAVTHDPLHLVFAKSLKKTALLERFDRAYLELKKAGKL